MTNSSSQQFRLSVDQILYLSAFAVGAAVRLLQIGDAPLGDGEAQAALHALAAARAVLEGVPLANAQPFYTAVSALFFSLVRDSSALARLAPALAGSLLVLLPWAAATWFPQIRQTGRWTGVILAFALALDPGMALLSRTAGSNMPGLFFTLLGLLGVALLLLPGALPPRTGAVIAGAAFGAAFLSGPALWLGLFILAITLVAARYLQFQLPELSRILAPGSLKPLGISALVTITVVVIAAPVLLGSPFELNGLGGSLAGFAARLASSSGVPALRLPAALLIYHPLALVFGLTAAIFAFLPIRLGNKATDETASEPSSELAASLARQGITGGLSLWAAIALLVVMLLPGREVADLVWVLIPLWVLAAIQLSASAETWLTSQPGQILTAAGVYVFLCAMLVLNLLNLSTLWPDLVARFQLTGAAAQASVIVAGIGLMVIIVSALFWLYWSPNLMGSALSLSAALVLLLALLGATWSLTRLHPDSPAELWRAADNSFPFTGQLSELHATLSLASIQETGHRPPNPSSGGVRTEMEVVLVEPLSASPALRWALRGFSLRSETAVAAAESAGAVLTSAASAQESARLKSKYRGQDLIWQSLPAWSGALPPGFFDWLFTRTVPQAPQYLIVWVRGDLFPGGSAP